MAHRRQGLIGLGISARGARRDQVDLVEVMEIADGLIQHHRIYWAWFGTRSPDAQ
jgi:hypothetical protein